MVSEKQLTKNQEGSSVSSQRLREHLTDSEKLPGYWLILLALLVAYVMVQLVTLPQNSPTHDEYWHLPIGLSMWQTGRFDQDRINPPLVRLWASFPLYWQGYRIETTGAESEGDYGDALISAYPQEYLSAYHLGRWMIVLLGLLGGWLLISIFRRGGDTASLMAGLFWLTDPHLTAHSGLVTHDLPSAVGVLAVLWAFWRYAEKPEWKTVIPLGICLGIAQLLKFTCLVLVPAVGIGLLILIYRSDSSQRGQRIWQLLAVFLIVSLIINGGYGFHAVGLSLRSAPIESNLFQSLQQLPMCRDLPIPLPQDYWLGLDRLFYFVAQPQPVFLEGNWSLDGFRSYYFKGWLYRVPHLIQLFAIIGLVAVLRGVTNSLSAGPLLWMGLSVSLFLFVSASLAGNQLGFRYLLPIYPVLLMLAVVGAELAFSRCRQPLKGVMFALVLIISCCNWRYLPDHLAYFNELAGGPASGKYLMIDSNVDWGQAIHRLDNHLRQENLELRGMAYFGSFPPSAVGWNISPPPAGKPQPGRYAVSWNYVMGRPHVLRTAENNWRPVDINEFAYFRFFEPVAEFGPSLQLYEISEADVLEFQRFMNP